MAANLVVRNARIWTGVLGTPEPTALAVEGERIVAIGGRDAIDPLVGPRTRVIDAGGRRVVPGFNDAHGHLMQAGFVLLGVDLRPARDEADFVERLRRHARSLPSGQWLLGENWDHEAWPTRRWPTRQLVDPISPDRPLFVRRLDGHIALANTAALRAAGIDRNTPDPAGGRIARDEAGEPTGIVIDTAMRLVAAAIPPPTAAEQRDAIRAATGHALSLGVTSFQAMGADAELPILQEMRRTGETTLRVNAVLSHARLDALRDLGVRAPFGDAWLRIGGVKIFADGSFGAGSALLFEPYEDRPETRGLAIHEEPELRALIARVHEAQLQAVVHAIGDRAVAWVLDACEALGPGGAERRHRVEHAQMVRPRDRERFARLCLVASIQPSHCTDDLRWIERRLGARSATAYPYRSLVEAGARIAVGTDWFVEPLDPMLALHAAVTRERPDGGGPAGGWYAAERVGIEQVLRDYTAGAAYAEFEEHRKGVLAPGMLADLVVLSQDVLAVEPARILRTQADVTVLGGRVAYERA